MKRKGLIFAGFLICFSAAGGAAQKPNVTALPISNRVIQGEAALANGEVVRFTSLEGSLVTIQGSEVGSFALSGEILDEGDSQVRFTVFEIQDFGGGNHGLKQLEQVEVRDKAPGPTSQAGIRTITAAQIERSGNVSMADVEAYRHFAISSLTGAEPAPENAVVVVDGTCCVTCGTTTACGCSVSMSCGSCCSDVCCPGGGTKPKPQNQGLQ